MHHYLQYCHTHTLLSDTPYTPSLRCSLLVTVLPNTVLPPFTSLAPRPSQNYIRFGLVWLDTLPSLTLSLSAPHTHTHISLSISLRCLFTFFVFCELIRRQLEGTLHYHLFYFLLIICFAFFLLAGKVSFVVCGEPKTRQSIPFFRW